MCVIWKSNSHYSDVMMGAMASQMIGVSSVCPTDCSGADRRKHQSAASLGFCEGNPPVTGGFPSQRASNAENVSIWWCHHANKCVLWRLSWASAMGSTSAVHRSLYAWAAQVYGSVLQIKILNIGYETSVTNTRAAHNTIRANPSAKLTIACWPDPVSI